MAMLADRYGFVVGVDTHRDTHTAAVLAASTGAALEIIEIPTIRAGFDELIKVTDHHTHNTPRVFVIEGTGSYGAGLARYLINTGEHIVEIDRPGRPKRRHGTKTDEIDAIRAGREALTRVHPGQPRSLDGQRAALATLLSARRSAKHAAVATKHQLHAMIITAPEPIRTRFRSLTITRIITTATTLRVNPTWDLATQTTATTLQRLARRARTLDTETAAYDTQLKHIVTQWRPDLLNINGVGPLTAATILCAWSHPNRFHSEAAFANLAGVAPIEASSGLNTRHRLNHHGDRQLNQAIHIITLCRLRHDPDTRTYANRRTTEGKTPAEIRRCLKRYITRHIYRTLQNPP